MKTKTKGLMAQERPIDPPWRWLKDINDGELLGGGLFAGQNIGGESEHIVSLQK